MELSITAIGRIGRQADVKHLDGGNAVISFSVATSEKWKNKNGEKQEKTTWVDCSVWRKSEHVKIAEYLKAGTLVYITGRPGSRGWVAKDGEKINTTITIRVDNFKFLGGGTATGNTSTTENNISEGPEGDDLPF